MKNSNEHQVPEWEKIIREHFKNIYYGKNSDGYGNYVPENAVDDFVEIFRSHHAHLKERVMDMQCDERKVTNFGNWQAITYEEKQLVNAVLSKVLDLLE